MVGIQGQRQTLTLLQNDSVRSAASSTNPHVGAELGKVRPHKMPHLPKSDGKAVFHCFSIADHVLVRAAEFAQQTARSPYEHAQAQEAKP
ncbi:hypothetical protein A9Z39_13160 [Paenibacillus polymyxa]|nr:hypothetical protein A9Z39_13160 [Paenibacillus polymyxa]